MPRAKKTKRFRMREITLPRKVHCQMVELTRGVRGHGMRGCNQAAAF